MSPKLKFVVSLAACTLFVAGAVAVLIAITWSALPPPQHALMQAVLADKSGAVLFLSLLLIAIFGILLRAVMQGYVFRPLQFAEETRLIISANPQHRVECSWPSEFVQLAAAINALAARCQSLQIDVDARVAEASHDLERERNQLAALMSELSESVIVCNAAGGILLYNERARQLLAGPADGDHPHGATDWIGLGRSLFAGIDREVVAHAVDYLHHRLGKGDSVPISEFLTVTRGGRLIRARMAAVASAAASPGPTVSGFVLVLDDIQRDVDLAVQRERLLQSLTENTRASLASIRAAAETLVQHPQMEPAQHRKFLNVIQDETERLGKRLEDSLSGDTGRRGGEWPLATMLGGDLLRALQRSLEARCATRIALESGDDPVWLRVDSFLLAAGFSHLASRLQRDGRAQDMALRMARSGSKVRLDLCWSHNALSVEAALEREKEPIVIPGHPQPLSFHDIVERHGGESWYQRDVDLDRARMCLLLPVTEEDAATIVPARAASRPTFYDFDLFHQAGQSPEIDQSPLSALSYTVFDTETTGLQPSQGDEIIAIGAVRIVNGRLLTTEVFDQLVNPCRDLEKASVRIHGITADMLRDQPTIERVLPRFHRFCENTVLVAHNAAFDMRFLQLKQDAAGVAFAHPVLDTLMLSAVVHPNQTEHHLEAIAARLGVNVIGRHTALGDAILTGEIFLKMILLLGQQGIVTFRQAHEAAQKTPFARISY
jgi:DNA polymerase-3 subunit epsilon